MTRAGRSCYRPLLYAASDRFTFWSHVVYLTFSLAFGKDSTLRGSDYMPFLCTGGCPSGGYDLPLTYFHARSSIPVQRLHQRQVGFPKERVCHSPACFRNSLFFFVLIRQGISHVVLVRPPPSVDGINLGSTLRTPAFFVASPFA